MENVHAEVQVQIDDDLLDDNDIEIVEVMLDDNDVEIVEVRLDENNIEIMEVVNRYDQVPLDVVPDEDDFVGVFDVSPLYVIEEVSKYFI